VRRFSSFAVLFCSAGLLAGCNFPWEQTLSAENADPASRDAKAETTIKITAPFTAAAVGAALPAEVYLRQFCWVPVDPADVRKVMLEEPPGNRPLDDKLVERARARLFGSWEMNRMVYNFGHDVVLAGSSRWKSRQRGPGQFQIRDHWTEIHA